MKALLFCLPLLLIHLCSDLPLAFIKLLSRFQLLIQFVFEILLDSQLLPLPPVLNLSYPIEVISDALSLIFQQFVLESNLAKVSCTTIICPTLGKLRVVKTSACHKSLMVELRAIRLNRIGIQQLHPLPNPQQVLKSSHLVMMLVQLGYILIRKTLLKKVELARDQRLNINLTLPTKLSAQLVYLLLLLVEQLAVDFFRMLLFELAIGRVSVFDRFGTFGLSSKMREIVLVTFGYLGHRGGI